MWRGRRENNIQQADKWKLILNGKRWHSSPLYGYLTSEKSTFWKRQKDAQLKTLHLYTHMQTCQCHSVDFFSFHSHTCEKIEFFTLFHLTMHTNSRYLHSTPMALCPCSIHLCPSAGPKKNPKFKFVHLLLKPVNLCAIVPP